MELVLEQTQQGTSHEVSVSTEGVEELKIKVKIKGEKKEALFTLRQKPKPSSDSLKKVLHSDDVSFQSQHHTCYESRMSITSDKGTTFGDGALRVLVLLTYLVGDLQKLINDIDAGKHGELLSELTNEDCMETLEALGSICNSIKVDCNNADVNPCKVSYVDDSINLNVNESTIPSDPIVQFMLLNISIPRKVVEKVSTRFEHTLYGYFIGKRMVFLVVEYYARNNWAKHRLKRIMMNSKGFFFFKFDSWVGLEAVLESGPWLISKSLIILKKWSMDTRLLKEELTRYPYGVKLHVVPNQFLKRMVVV
ncbi:zinc knuckle CX2CX4HX4C containing protein [Tanacetum coccineum]|uniref:Zinc knuckle CX2CX4HX4C containing protein n=1 Tax=Tanacetum coccineum TaxID=301880 RepID=A0ABQ5HUT1_9ASTR